MSVFWNNFLELIKNDRERHELRQPCSYAQLRLAEVKLGKCPDSLALILRSFNGARLFINEVELITLFPLSSDADTLASRWPKSWFINEFTDYWRKNQQCGDEWVFGIMNYGDILIMTSNGFVKRWISSDRSLDKVELEFNMWIQSIAAEGAEYLNG